jgi:hypothetical protein
MCLLLLLLLAEVLAFLHTCVLGQSRKSRVATSRPVRTYEYVRTCSLAIGPIVHKFPYIPNWKISAQTFLFLFLFSTPDSLAFSDFFVEV